jgi:hypothetical protein
MNSEKRIRERAYAIWEQEGRPEGKELEHYLRAKRMLEDESNASPIETPEPSPSTLLPPPKPKAAKRRGPARRPKKA